MTEESSEEIKLAEILTQVTKLVRKNGYEDSIRYLKMLNSRKSDVTDPTIINIYQYLIKCTCEEYDITSNELFKSTTKHVTTSARMTFYVTLTIYFKWTHNEIATDVNKSRTTVTMALQNFTEMCKDRTNKAYKDFFDKHDRIESRIIEYIRDLSKHKSPQQTLPPQIQP